jgi:hypothetical protein
MIEPGRGQELMCGGFLPGGDRQQEMLCLDRRRSVLSDLARWRMRW